MWPALLTLVGRPDLVTDDPLATSQSRGDEVDASIRAWTLGREKFEAMRILAEAGIPAGAVLSGEEVIADPHVEAREMIVEVEHESYGRAASSARPSSCRVHHRPSPLLHSFSASTPTRCCASWATRARQSLRSALRAFSDRPRAGPARPRSLAGVRRPPTTR